MRYLFSSTIITSCLLMGCYEYTDTQHINKINQSIKLDKSSITLSSVNNNNFLSIANFSTSDYLINIEYRSGNEHKQHHKSLLISEPSFRLNPNSITSVTISLNDILTDDMAIHNNTTLIIKTVKLGKKPYQNGEYEKIQIPVIWI